MKRASAVLISVIFLSSQGTVAQIALPPPSPPAAAIQSVSIEGRVVNALTGEPVPRANLMLQVTPTRAGLFAGGMVRVVQAVSDAEGKFKFELLEPGSYSLSGGRTGFLRREPGLQTKTYSPDSGFTFAAAPGQQVKDLEFKLLPQAIISGRVVDEYGDPVPGIFVEAFRLTSYFHRLTTMGGKDTNAIGEFLIGGLWPGKYVLRARWLQAPPRGGREGTDPL